jgi:hypothetical protein
LSRGEAGHPRGGGFAPVACSNAVKWHFIDYLYLETGYSYYGKTGTNITGLSVKTRYTKEEKYDMDASIFLTDRHVIYLGIGVGF